MTTWSAALGWERWHAANARMMGPVVTWLGDAAGAAPGVRVLDVACGTGLPAHDLARRGAEVTATDLSEDMLAACGRLADAAGVSITRLVRDAHALGFDADAFDAATCAFGLMFCADAAGAVAELVRVVRPGGAIAIAVWDLPAHNPFFTTIFGAIAQVVPPAAPPDPRAGMFRFGPPGELAAVLAAGGVRDVVIEPVEMAMELASVDEAFTLYADMAAPVHAAVTSLPADQVARLRRLHAEATAPFVVDGGAVRLPSRALCARGRA